MNSLWEGDVEPISRFLDAYKEPNKISADYDNRPCFMFAALLRNSELLSRVIEMGANVNGGFGECLITPLHMACTLRIPEAISILIKAGVDVNKEDVIGNTPAYKLFFYRKNEDELVSRCLKILLTNGCNLFHQSPKKNWSPFHSVITCEAYSMTFDVVLSHVIDYTIPVFKEESKTYSFEEIGRRNRLFSQKLDAVILQRFHAFQISNRIVKTRARLFPDVYRHIFKIVFPHKVPANF